MRPMCLSTGGFLVAKVNRSKPSEEDLRQVGLLTLDNDGVCGVVVVDYDIGLAFRVDSL